MMMEKLCPKVCLTLSSSFICNPAIKNLTWWNYWWWRIRRWGIRQYAVDGKWTVRFDWTGFTSDTETWVRHLVMEEMNKVKSKMLVVIHEIDSLWLTDFSDALFDGFKQRDNLLPTDLITGKVGNEPPWKEGWKKLKYRGGNPMVQTSKGKGRVFRPCLEETAAAGVLWLVQKGSDPSIIGHEPMNLCDPLSFFYN